MDPLIVLAPHTPKRRVYSTHGRHHDRADDPTFFYNFEFSPCLVDSVEVFGQTQHDRIDLGETLEFSLRDFDPGHDPRFLINKEVDPQ
ncbi:MAG: hypothetical protein B5766_05520 [Candidatus Lumbricidophila eiseniae]|uniref:Uncharacterized protein n=1 Tax=Candidatus Lumbricidiphila eiseniae TaxID=1969409 RepID=A0A2A6FRK9_9MICO|nr:MAG: hypothetical protein B5766_05520 [Candidatus Lumbricidophila eiseniae]